MATLLAQLDRLIIFLKLYQNNLKLKQFQASRLLLHKLYFIQLELLQPHLSNRLNFRLKQFSLDVSDTTQFLLRIYNL